MSFRKQFQMKSGFTIIAALLLMLQSGEIHAANLKYVRTAKHQDFTRIVFEFRNAAQFKEPVIHGEGKFSVAFPDSTTVLPRQIFYRTTQIQPVYSIEFIQKQTLLTAVIKLSFSEFKLKAFSLSDPNRVVIDAYKTIPPPGESMPEASLHSKSMAKKSMETEIKDPKAVPEESPAKELTRVVKKDPKGIPDKFPATQTGNTFEIKKNAASDIIQDQIEDITESPPAERVGSGGPPEGGYNIGKAPLGLSIRHRNLNPIVPVHSFLVLECICVRCLHPTQPY